MSGTEQTAESNQIIASAGPQTANMAPMAHDSTEGALSDMLVQRWRTMLLVSSITAGIMVPAIWLLLKPKYEVAAAVHVAPFVPPILFSDYDTDISRRYREYIVTEAATMLGPAVISAALEAPEVRSLPFVLRSLDPASSLREEISVEQEKGTQLLRAAMIGEDPDEMAAIINSVVSTYLKRHNDKQRERDKRILSSLHTEARELETKLEVKARQLQQAAVVNGLVGAEPSGSLIDTLMVELEQLLTQAMTDKAVAARKLQAISGDDADINPVILDPADFEAYLGADLELQSLKEQLRSVALSALSDNRLGRGPSHPDVQSRAAVVAALSEGIESKKAVSRKAYIASQRQKLQVTLRDMEITANVIRGELDKLTAQRSDLAGQLYVLGNLRHEREQIEQSLNRVREKIWNVEVEQNRIPRITLASPAQAPESPNIDKRGKYSAAALALSLFMGMGAVVLRSRFDTRLRNPEEVAERLGVRVLGSVQRIDNHDAVQQAIDRRIVEPIRGISAALLSSSPAPGAHTRLITSPTPGSGKSLLALNLAHSLAATGRNVLLIDADNDGQGVTRRLHMLERPGLRDLLEGTIAAHEAICSCEISQLKVLPAGSRDERFGEWLSGRRAHVAMQSLFKTYDEVIVDSPPVLATSNTVILATLVDEIVLVLRSGRSTRKEVFDAQQYLASVGGNIVGIIVNGVDPRNAYYSYSYAYAGSDYAGVT